MPRLPTLRTAPAALAFALALSACAGPAPAPVADDVELLWDTWGVPHIFADQEADLFYGFGWAQARSHGDLILQLHGQSRGRAAEYWGEQYLDSDRWVWTMGIPGRAEAWLAEQDPEMRSYIDAFVAGFNEFAETHPETIADEMKVVLPITAADILAHTQRIIHFTFIVSPREIAGVRNHMEQAGSNAWAIGPSRSESGNTLLVANPHLPWSDLFTWYEAQLVGPEVDIYGTTLIGVPFLSIAFNDYLGWTHTVNTHDGYDLFRLTLDGDGYRYDGETRPFDLEEMILQVRREDGSFDSETLSIRRSLHGPVVAQNGNSALALAVVGLDAPHLLRQYWDMGRATDLAEFEAAIRPTQMPMFTFMYADRDGNILHHFGGETPLRPQGDWATWSQPVPGDTSDWAWSGVHSYDELPTVLNPESGWLQNANDPPWTTTFPRALDPTAFPPYMAPRFMTFRAQRSAGMLAADDSITFDEAVDYKFSTRMELADRILDDLAIAVESDGDQMARDAMEVLAEWDRAAEVDSRGAVLFSRFAAEMNGRGQSLNTPLPATGFAIAWDPTEPTTTPDGLADPAVAAAALSAAAEAVAAQHNDLGVAWGEVNRLQRGDHDYPGNGGPGGLGIFRVAHYAPEKDGSATAMMGDTWVAIVEFSDPVRARVALSYGNASQPGSPHNGDQLRLFSEKTLRPAWRQRDEIEANLELREVLASD